MENIKDVIRMNLIKCRKDNKLTQLELSEKINYSDKALSRWETGEVTPDVETLNVLADLYGIPLTYFFEIHEKKESSVMRFKKIQIGNKMAISLLGVLCVWFIAVIVYVYVKTILEINSWMLFIWAIPLSCLMAVIFNSIWGTRTWTFIFVSCLCWTTILAVYLQFIQYNMYLIFIVGAPLQVGIILWSCIKVRDNHNDLK